MFPSVRLDLTGWLYDILGWFSPFVVILKLFGQAAIFIISTWLVVKYGFKILTACTNARRIHEMMGFNWRLIFACCPQHFLLDRETDRAVGEDTARKPTKRRQRRIEDSDIKYEYWTRKRQRRNERQQQWHQQASQQ